MEQNTDKSIEVEQLRTKLADIQARYKENIEKIDKIKTNLITKYRHHDRDKYVKEREQIAKDLHQLDAEMTQIKNKINEMGG